MKNLAKQCDKISCKYYSNNGHYCSAEPKSFEWSGCDNTRIDLEQTDDETKNMALYKAGRLIVDAFPNHYGYIRFNLQGMRKSVHTNEEFEIIVKISKTRQFLDPNKLERNEE